MVPSRGADSAVWVAAVDVGTLRRCPPDETVHLVAEVDGPHLDGHPGVLGGEFGEDSDGVGHRRLAADGPDPQMAVRLAGEGGGDVLQSAHGCQALACFGHQGLTGGGEVDLARGASQQINTESFLQRPDLLAQRRLCQEQALGRTTEVQLLGQDQEKSQLVAAGLARRWTRPTGLPHTDTTVSHRRHPMNKTQGALADRYLVGDVRGRMVSRANGCPHG